METRPFNKKIWYVITQRSSSITRQDLQHVLDLVEDSLFEGICQYDYFTEDSYSKWKEKINCKDVKLGKLVHRLSHDLNLDSSSLWCILCNYLMFEYNGKIEDLANISLYDLHLAELIHTIYQFYSSERMYMLRSTNYILQNQLNSEPEKTPYNDLYVKFVKKETIPKIRKQLFAQLQKLIFEITTDSKKFCIDLAVWANRNLQEQLYVIFSIILTMQIQEITFEELKEFLNICINYSFTLLPPYEQIEQTADVTLRKSVMYAEYATCIIAFNQIKKLSEVKQLSTLIEPIDKRHGALLLIWNIIKHNLVLTQDESDELESSDKYNVTAAGVTDEEIFQKLYEILVYEKLMNSCVGKIVRKSIFKLLQYICHEYDQTLDVFNIYTVTLLSKLMEDEEIAHESTTNQMSINIITAAARLFPLDFYSFSLLIKSIIRHNDLCLFLLPTITTLAIYTEDYGSTLLEGQERKIDFAYSPKLHEIQGPDLNHVTFPIGTDTVMWSRNGRGLITYNTRYSYFYVLYQHIYYVCYTEEPNMEDVRNVLIGLEIICELLHNKELVNHEIIRSRDLGLCVHYTTALLTKASKAKYLPLVKVCFNIFLSFVHFNLQQAIEVLHVMNFLPVYTHYELTLKNALQRDSLTYSYLIEFIHEESKQNTHDILLLYLKFFRHCFDKNIFYKKVQLPGFTFILQTILPKHLEWLYNDIHQKHSISLNCLELIFEVLQQNPKTIANKEQKAVYYYILNTFHDNINSVKSYITIFRIAFRDVFTLMQNEVDWESGKSLQIFKILKYCLSIFMIFLNLYTEGKESHKHIIESCFSLDLKPNVIKIITGLIGQGYDLPLRKLACLVLRKVVENYNIPLMAYLDMDQIQIQGTFLQMLRDPVEEDEMKLLILDFISTCVRNGQHGMCAAFFNVSTKKDEKKKDVGDSVTNFMVEHLKTLVQPDAYLNNPLQTSMLDLYHTLWMSHKSVLISELVKNKHFWPMLADPLFKDLILNDKGYAKILDILTLEIMKNVNSIDANLKQVIRNIFNPKTKFLKNWHVHIILSIEEDKEKDFHEVLPSLRIIWSWKNFLMVCVKHIPECFDVDDSENQVKVTVSEYCLRGLQCHLMQPEDVRVLTAFASLYLFCINQWGISCYGNPRERLKLLADIYSQFNDFVEVLSAENKEAVLAIAPKTLIDVKDCELRSKVINPFLSSIVPIVEREYKILNAIIINEGSSQQKNPEIYKNWNTLINFGTSVLNVRSSERYGWWFQSAEFIERVMYFVGVFVEYLETMPSAKVAVSFLVKYAESPLYKDYAHIDTKEFYCSITPPGIYDISNISLEKFSIVQLEDWWYTYRGVLSLNIKLMQQLDVLVKKTVFNLFSLQVDIVHNLLLLPSVTAELSALKLVKTLVTCFHLSLKWKHTWNTEYHEELERMVITLTNTLNACVLILLRPKVINGYRIDEKKIIALTDQIPESLFVEIMETVIDIFGLILQCFIEINPSLLQVLDIIKPIDEIFLSIHHENMFPSTLGSTLGTLFHALHFLCKAASQIHTRKSTPKKTAPSTRDQSSLTVDNKRYFLFVTTEMNVPQPFEKVGNTLIKHKEGVSLTASWVFLLNAEKVNRALERLAGFLTQQIFYSISLAKNRIQSEVLKRKIQADIQVFHDFTKKRVQEISHQYYQLQGQKKTQAFLKKQIDSEAAAEIRAKLNRSESEDILIVNELNSDDMFLHLLSLMLQNSTRLSAVKM